MPLACYSAAAQQEFWTEHWGAHAVAEMLASARGSPLTALVTEALPAAGPVLEAGCGLGQYVLLLRERGWPVVGVDWSVEALGKCRRFAQAPLAAMELPVRLVAGLFRRCFKEAVPTKSLGHRSSDR